MAQLVSLDRRHLFVTSCMYVIPILRCDCFMYVDLLLTVVHTLTDQVFKGWVQRCHNFSLFSLLYTFAHTFIIHSSVAFAELHSIFLHCCRLAESLHWGDKPRIELRPYSSPTRYHLCYAARTLAELRHNLTAPQQIKLPRTETQKQLLCTPHQST
jgi:hypothetical protein